MDTSQYLDIFIDETKEHLQSLNEHILVLEKEPENEDTINEIFLLVDKGSYQFRRIHITAAHFEEMRIAVSENGIYNFLCVINFADCGDCIGSMMGTDNQRLRFII